MAIDTRNKRASVISLNIAGGLFPNPDGSIANVPDRQEIAMLYAGISSGATPSVTQIPWHLFFRRTV